MADINTQERRNLRAKPGRARGRGGMPGAPREQRTALMQFAELLFFAYRDFISDPDAILTEYGFGRAHHRVLHFVSRYPGMRVADLLDILGITKQSLGRVLKQLVDQNFIEQRAGRKDRRERLLFLTATGRTLAERLAAPQRERLARALAGADGDAKDGSIDDVARRFLYYMITEQGRSRVAELLSRDEPRS